MIDRREQIANHPNVSTGKTSLGQFADFLKAERDRDLSEAKRQAELDRYRVWIRKDIEI